MSIPLSDDVHAEERISDRTLLRRFAHGQRDAATELYLRYAGRLAALAKSKSGSILSSRFDPEDVVQSVFRTFFRRASEGLYEVPPGDELWQLLLVLALNKVRALGAFHRAQKRDVTRTLDERGLLTTSETADDVAVSVLRMVVEDKLDELPLYQRRMIELRIAGHEIGEIAARTNRSKRTVERVLQQFRGTLAKAIDYVETSG
jgi:RNA polymerase sigma-70 factor (ECF subfamily)